MAKCCSLDSLNNRHLSLRVLEAGSPGSKHWHCQGLGRAALGSIRVLTWPFLGVYTVGGGCILSSPAPIHEGSYLPSTPAPLGMRDAKICSPDSDALPGWREPGDGLAWSPSCLSSATQTADPDCPLKSRVSFCLHWRCWGIPEA